MVAPSSPSGRSGFTLVELLVVIAIVSILVTVAAPSFNRIVVQQRLRAAANEMRNSVSVTRSEAVKRNAASGVKLVRRDGGWGAGWCVINPESSAVGCSGPEQGTAYVPTNYLSEVRLTDGVSVSRVGTNSTSNSLTFNNWGRTQGCPKFQFQANAGDSTCTVCLFVESDGRVVTEADTCPTDNSTCSSDASDATAWSEACQ